MTKPSGAAAGGSPFHPQTERHRRRAREKLGFRDASTMAIGGMIGGGIFSVLGVTTQLAGHLAFMCFVLAGGVAPHSPRLRRAHTSSGQIGWSVCVPV